MGLQSVRAIYKKDGTLVFADPGLVPKEGVEVIVTYLEKSEMATVHSADLIRSLRGRGKGEKLVERLLQSRQEDREYDERNRRHLRA
jgi:predicted GNAT family acetyltransferase